MVMERVRLGVTCKERFKVRVRVMFVFWGSLGVYLQAFTSSNMQIFQQYNTFQSLR